MRHYTKEQLFEACREAKSLTDVSRRLGFKRHPNKNLLGKIKALNIDTGHWKHQPGERTKRISVRYELGAALVLDSPYVGVTCLKRRILKEGLLKNECAECGNIGEWRGNPLALQLHHKNGDSKDNRLENLQILCPNCHSQTDNYKGRNRKDTLAHLSLDLSSIE